jgi:Pyridoxamine 5'-phosphate oxidase
VSRRDQITMSPGEVAAFLAEQRVVTCATLGPRGWPHLMALWYVLRDGPAGSPHAGSDPPPAVAPGQRIWAWTYAASQKVRNLERDPRATLLVESGEQYQELKGVMFECEVAVHSELETVAALGIEIFKRYAPPSEEPPAEEPSAGQGPADPPAMELAAIVERQASKRVALEFAELRRASWDHGKLGGTY